MLEKRLEKMEQLVTCPQEEEKRDQLPSKEIIDHIFDLYIELFAIYPLCIDIKRMKESIKNNTYDRFLLYSLLSTVARFSPRQDIRRKSDIFAETAHEMMSSVLDKVDFNYVQGLIILSLYQLSHFNGYKAWLYSTIVVRMVCELGLYKEKLFDESPGTIISVEQWMTYEYERRAFWMTSMMDTYGGACTGTPMSLYIEDYNLLLPTDLSIIETNDDFYQETFDGSRLIHYHVIRDPFTQMAENIQVWPLDPRLPENQAKREQIGVESFISKANAILGMIVRTINRQLHSQDTLCYYRQGSDYYKHDKTLDAWPNDLPFNLRDTPANAEKLKGMSPIKLTQYFVMHLIHYATIILLNRPALVMINSIKKETDQGLIKAVHQSAGKCIEAANRVSLLLKTIRCKADLLPCYIGYLIYVTGTVIVSDRSFIGGQIDNSNIEDYLYYLNECKTYWGITERFYFMIYNLHLLQQVAFNSSQKEKQVPFPSSSVETTLSGTTPLFDPATTSHTSTESESQHEEEGQVNDLAKYTTPTFDDRQLDYDNLGGFFLPLSHPLGTMYTNDGSFDLWLQNQLK
ncbi:hypothetical protein CU097_002594 [Rhizopus azygosporus]|uniref:Xylanolytic transcriptional activator regulatory domain-containing protein n=1 Tax=Rhizopus azygosporus TaxID=86630 RepID=A0A367J1Z5_RHIAZ|nr:hypothetical protein CU097_002594 [Rhizopus azygosporus]